MQWGKTGISAYWAVFVTAFFVVAIWETLRPRRELMWSAEKRWGCHALLLVVSGFSLKAVLWMTPIAVAIAVAASPYGLLNRPWAPLWLTFPVAIVLLDLSRYLVHRAFHSFDWLWRVHEVHHSDPDYDVSTGGRFHPIEVIAVQASYLTAILLLAPPVAAVFAAEMIAVAANFFAHGNVSLPDWLEWRVRSVFITPNLHRIHHSEDISEQSRNFGQTFSWWDRWFGTYQARPNAGEDRISTGVTGLQSEASYRIGFVLARPFQHRPDNQTDSAA